MAGAKSYSIIALTIANHSACLPPGTTSYKHSKLLTNAQNDSKTLKPMMSSKRYMGVITLTSSPLAWKENKVYICVKEKSSLVS